MTNGRALVLGALAIALISSTATAQELSKYRTFELGASMATVLTATGVPQTQVRTLYQRPVLLQDVEWRPSRWATGSTANSADPVDQMRFSFYDDRLFRIVVDYGRERTAGMTDSDLVEAISSLYGIPLLPGKRATVRAPSTLEPASGAVIARWGDDDHAIALYRISSYGDTLRLIVTGTAVDDLARRAAVEGARLDVEEGPQKEIDRQKREREEERTAAEKARAANKPVFKP